MARSEGVLEALKPTLADYIKIGTLAVSLIGAFAVTREHVIALEERVTKIDEEGPRATVQSIEELRGETRVIGAKLDALRELIERSERRRAQ